MTSTWDFPRDEVPTTVRGLMSLWGGFDEPENPVDAGLEKRLELDVTFLAGEEASAGMNATDKTSPRGMLRATSEQWSAVLSILDESIHRTSSQGLLSAYYGERCIIITSPRRVVITASPEVMLHKITVPLLQLVSDCGCGVEWVSYMRKNTCSPWDADDETNLIMAAEYAELKHAFPKGNPFLLGPVDSDHYFYFVYDNVDRTSGDTVEDDIQVNVVMYNVNDVPCDKTFQDIRVLTPTTASAELEQQRPLLCEGHELIRRFSVRSVSTCDRAQAHHAVSCLTFETNDPNMDHKSRIAELLERYRPARFTLITLFDPQSTVARRFAEGDRCGLDTFSHYTVENRATNEFAPGYVIRKTVFFQKE